MKHARPCVIFEQFFLTDREKRPMQRGVHRQLVFGPLDRSERGPNGIDFFALVKGLAADEQVRDTTSLELLDVVARDVLAEMQEAAEQQADVTRDDLSAERT